MKTTAIEKAIVALNSAQLSSAQGSHIADIDPRALLGVTTAFLVLMLSVPLNNVGMIIWFAVYPIVSAPLAHISYERLFVKSLYILPFLLLLGVFNPIFDRRAAFIVGGVGISNGWVTFFAIVVRGLLAMQALLVLVHVAGFNRICEALRCLKVPKVLVVQLLMVYRYLSVLLTEALTMHRARVSRGYGRKAYSLSMWGAFVGRLLVRSVDRASRINKAMLARGFDGSLTVKRNTRWNVADTLYCFIWSVVLIALRLVDFSNILFHGIA